MAGHGGGAWKVAYADFVTAMMAFFMVMWIVAQGDPVKEAVAQYFKDPFQTASSKPGESGGPAGTTVPDLLKQDAPAPSIPRSPRGGSNHDKKSRLTRGQGPGLHKPSMLTLHDGDRSMTGTVVFFAEASAELNDAGKDALRQIVPALLGKRYKIEIRGHASGRPLPAGSPFPNPWQLCYARCLAVMQYLEKAGIETERLRLSQAGTYEPQTLKVDAQNQAKNSRVEVYVVREAVDDLVGTREERAERFRTPGGSH